jgi:hypothetical protein
VSLVYERCYEDIFLNLRPEGALKDVRLKYKLKKINVREMETIFRRNSHESDSSVAADPCLG